MASSFTDRTIALAGIFQAASLVHQLATSGEVDESAMRTSTDSLFMIDADDVPSVFESVSGVSHGLRMLAAFSGNDKSETNMIILGYVFSLMHLTHKLLNRPQLLDHLSDLVSGVQRQKEYFESMQDDSGRSILYARFADIYSETISTMQPRIIVKGSPDFLQRDDIVHRIRCLLLAGVRSAVLWEQLGGGRLQFLLRRKKYALTAEDLLAASQ